MNIYKIYDNGGETVDRYTILLGHHNFGCAGASLAVSDDPAHPTHGFSQWGEATDGEHLGKEIKFEDLPKNVQEHITERLKEEETSEEAK